MSLLFSLLQIVMHATYASTVIHASDNLEKGFRVYFFSINLRVEKVLCCSPNAWRARSQTETHLTRTGHLTTCLLSVTDLCYETPQDVIMKRDFSTSHERHCSRWSLPPPRPTFQLCSGVTMRTNREGFCTNQLMTAQEGTITRQTQM